MPINDKSRENLIPATKGEVRNPKGKVKGTLNTKTILRKLLAAKLTDEETGEEMTAHEMMLSNLLKSAIIGDRKYVETVLDRLDGKPAQSLEVKEKTIDDLEKLSEKQLKDRAKAIMEKINDSGSTGTTSD